MDLNDEQKQYNASVPTHNKNSTEKKSDTSIAGNTLLDYDKERNVGVKRSNILDESNIDESTVTNTTAAATATATATATMTKLTSKAIAISKTEIDDSTTQSQTSSGYDNDNHLNKKRLKRTVTRETSSATSTSNEEDNPRIHLSSSTSLDSTSYQQQQQQQQKEIESYKPTDAVTEKSENNNSSSSSSSSSKGADSSPHTAHKNDDHKEKDDRSDSSIKSNNDSDSTTVKPESKSRSAARGIPIDAENLDREEVDLAISHDDDDDDDNIENLTLEDIMALAAQHGIPLDILPSLLGSQSGRFQLNHTDEDDDDVELPFDPPQSIKDVAQFIHSDQCQNIVILAGAGMSVASGIPDFRSPVNGLYATLQAEKLTCLNEETQQRIERDPSYSLDQRLFLENPLPCLEVNRDFILGLHSDLLPPDDGVVVEDTSQNLTNMTTSKQNEKSANASSGLDDTTIQPKWKATLAHRMVELLHTKTDDKLCRLYTQNIDGLEDQCVLPHSKRIAVHGSLDEAMCAQCGTEMSMKEFAYRMKTQIKDWTGQDVTAPKMSRPIICHHCGMPTVKPNIVLFRSSLPETFFRNVPQDTEKADLLIVLGTSLGVAPANSIVWRVPKQCMRVVINREPVGWHLGMDFSRNSRDYFEAGNCEDVCLALISALGWLEELRPYLSTLPLESQKILRQAFDEEVSTASTTTAAAATTTTPSTTTTINNK